MKTRFKNAHPLMVYMSIKQRALVKLFSQKQRLPVSQLVREGLLMRMAGDDRYNSGWNDALDEAMRIAGIIISETERQTNEKVQKKRKYEEHQKN